MLPVVTERCDGRKERWMVWNPSTHEHISLSTAHLLCSHGALFSPFLPHYPPPAPSLSSPLSQGGGYDAAGGTPAGGRKGRPESLMPLTVRLLSNAVAAATIDDTLRRAREGARRGDCEELCGLRAKIARSALL